LQNGARGTGVPGTAVNAAREIGGALDGFTVIITKSTVPVGTGDEVARIIHEARQDADVAVVSNPEFLREGAAIQDFKHPDRIVVGTDDERARKVMAEIYRPLYLNRAPRSAERVGADVQDVAGGIGLDNRIGAKFVHPGPGFGGSCFPKDYTHQDRAGP
jgi:UDPglucose 6-dehydrogenase